MKQDMIASSKGIVIVGTPEDILQMKTATGGGDGKGAAIFAGESFMEEAYQRGMGDAINKGPVGGHDTRFSGDLDDFAGGSRTSGGGGFDTRFSAEFDAGGGLADDWTAARSSGFDSKMYGIYGGPGGGTGGESGGVGVVPSPLPLLMFLGGSPPPLVLPPNPKPAASPVKPIPFKVIFFHQLIRPMLLRFLVILAVFPESTTESRSIIDFGGFDINRLTPGVLRPTAARPLRPNLPAPRPAIPNRPFNSKTETIVDNPAIIPLNPLIPGIQPAILENILNSPTSIFLMNSPIFLNIGIIPVILRINGTIMGIIGAKATSINAPSIWKIAPNVPVKI